MSYILDALRKSEQERAAGTPAASIVPNHAPPRSESLRWSGLLAAFLLLIVALAVFLYWRSSEPITEPAPAVVANLAKNEEAIDRERRLDEELTAPPLRPAPAVRRPAPPAIPVANASQAPYLRELSADFQQQLPALKIDIHVFTPGGQSILYINNREYRPGEQIQSGLRVEAIVQEGAVLSYNGQSFKLPRPNR